MKIKFESEEHRDFFFAKLKESSNQDSYHQSLFYAFGIDRSCRKHFNDLFDMKNHRIKPNGLYRAWQTSGSICTSKLAFNLWNGCVEDKHEKESTPYELFACEHASYFFEAIKLRYPEYCKEPVIKSNVR